MDLLLSNPLNYLDLFFLVLARTSSLFIACPIFSSRNIPIMAKLLLSFFLSIIIINLNTVDAVVSSSDIYLYAIAVIREIFIGWVIGMSAYFVFSVMTLAGQFIDQEIGYTMVNVFDPLSQVQFTITGTLYFYMLITMVILSNGHHYFIRALVNSYKFIPIGTGSMTVAIYETFRGFMNELFLIALQIAAPFFFAILITDIVLGILARTVPQMNLFVIGFPIKILFGLVVLLITLNIFPSVVDLVMDHTLKMMDQVIKGMVKP